MSSEHVSLYNSNVVLKTISVTLQTITKIMLRKQILSLIPFRDNLIQRVPLCFLSRNTEKSEISDEKRQFLRQSQGLHAFRPNECPENPTIILFPGQGSQFVGMAKSLVGIPEAKDMFDIASDVLRYSK